MRHAHSLFWTVVCCLLFATRLTAVQDEPPAVKADELAETRNVHVCGDLFLSGQFSEDDLESIKARGIKRIISLRTDGELDWDEKGIVESLGIEFHSIPFRAPDSLTDEVFNKLRNTLQTAGDGATLLHCGSANRVGAVWMAHRVLDEGVDVETAYDEAREIGLNSESYEAKALDYIRRKQEGDPESHNETQEESVKPGINESFLNPELEVDRYIERFEIESREVYAARKEVVAACGIKGGDKVADIGAGTGIYTRMFAREVGADGWVFAVDIAPRFIQHINETSDELGMRNITGVICREDSVSLPPESVDVVFICDTYHHFEFPNSTGSSILNALKPGGTLVLIDFERIPGTTREWLLNHVRAGKDVFRSEVESMGFEFVEEIEIDGFEENYFLKFRKSK